MNQYAARLRASLLAISLLLSLAACGGKDKATAAAMHLRRTEGTVAVSDGGGKDVPVLQNLSLYGGYGVNTRSASYAWIDLDDVKLTKLDQNSEIAIRKQGKALEIEVKSGSLFFNVTRPLADDETMDIRTSTMMTGIRGTCGWVENRDGFSRAYLLEGEAECSAGGRTVRVRAGEMGSLTAGGELTVSAFTARDIPDFVLDELKADDDLARAVLEDSGIDVLSPREPDNITGVVTDCVTGRPLKGAVVICENGGASAQAETDSNGVYHIFGLPAGEYQIHASRGDCEEGPSAGVVLDGAAATLDLTLRPFYAQAYMDYLLERQVGLAGMITYERGQGRFALIYLTDGDIPELLHIGEYGVGSLLTWHEGEIRFVGFDNGSTDLTYLNWENLRVISGEAFAMGYDSGRGSGWRIYEKEPDQALTYILRADIFVEDGNYYCNEYDEAKMHDWETAYDHVVNFENHRVSQTEYRQALAAYGVNEETNRRLTEADIHYITPEEIARVFAKPSAPPSNTSVAGYRISHTGLDTGVPLNCYFERPVFDEITPGYAAINAFFENLETSFFNGDNLANLIKEAGASDGGVTYDYYYDAEVAAQGRSYVGVHLSGFRYTGGARPVHTDEHHVLSTVTGEPLGIRDFLDGSDEEILGIINTALAEFNRAHNNALFTTELSRSPDSYDFCVQDGAVHIFFNPGDIAPVSVGFIDLTLPAPLALD